MQPEATNPILSEIATSINTDSDLGELFRRLHYSVEGLLAPASVSFQVALYNELENHLQYFSKQPSSGFSEDRAVSLDASSEERSALVIKGKQPLLLNKAEIVLQTSREKTPPSESIPTCWLGVPILVRNHTAGIVILQSFSDDLSFQQGELTFLKALADQIAVAIDRKQSQIHYKKLLTSANNIVFSTNSQGRFQHLSGSTQAITGYSTDQLEKTFHWSISNSVHEVVNVFVHVEDKAYLAQLLETARIHRHRYQAEYRLVRKDGSIRWVSERGRFYRDKTGRVILDAIITDIHDRRKAELVNKVLYTISNAVNTTQHFNELFTVVHEALSLLITIEHFGIGLYDREKDSLSFTYNFPSLQTEHPAVIQQISSSNTLPAEIIRTGNPLLISKADPSDAEITHTTKFYDSGFETWLGVPLEVNGQVIGIMFSELHKKSTVYTHEDLECFRSVADQLAIALDRKESEERISFREKIITTLYSISTAIHTSGSLYQLYKAIHQALKLVINADTLSISVYEPKTDTLHFHYSADQIDLSMLDPIENVSKTNSLTYQVIKTGKSLLLDEAQKSSLQKKLGGGMIGAVASKCWLGVPLKGKQGTLGAIVNQSYTDPYCYTQKDVDLLEMVSDQVAFAIEYKRAEAELVSTQKELLEKAHKAGMADIASDTIHNLGTTLSNIKTSNNQIRELLKGTQAFNLNKAIKLLKDKQDDLHNYFRKDPGSTSVMQYLLGIKRPFNHEYDQIRFQTRRQAEKILFMTNVIRNQQNYVYNGTLEEESTLKDIVSNILDAHQNSLEQHGIRVERNFDDIPQILVNRAKLRHIIMNLIENARDAMTQTTAQNRLLSVTLSQNTTDIFLAFRDNGEGIETKNLNKIFAQGFTTKKTGHGFGLHNCANLAMSMQGTLWAESEGAGKGATFTLRFPKR